MSIPKTFQEARSGGILEAITRAGCRILLRDGRLRVQARTGPVPPDVLALVHGNQGTLLAALAAQESTSREPDGLLRPDRSPEDRVDGPAQRVDDGGGIPPHLAGAWQLVEELAALGCVATLDADGGGVLLDDERVTEDLRARMRAEGPLVREYLRWLNSGTFAALAAENRRTWIDVSRRNGWWIPPKAVN